MKRIMAVSFCMLTAGCAPVVETGAGALPGEPAASPAAASAPAAADTTERVQIPTVPLKEVDRHPRLISGSPPSYSLAMIQNNVEGIVKAQMLVNSRGAVKDVVILEHLGHGTDAASREALMKYQFEPAMKDGTPVAVWIDMEVNFRPMRR
jgi:protein TonB